MILARLPRALALVVVFFGSMLLAVLLTPLVFAPFVLDNSAAEFVDFLLSYYEILIPSIVSPNGLTQIFLVGAVIWSAIAVLFLAPITGKVRATSETRSLLTSVIAAIVVGALLCGILAASAVELVLALLAADAKAFESSLRGRYAVMTSVMLAGWVGGGFVVAMLLRGVSGSRNPNHLERILRVIFAGTVIELALGIPIYLLVRRKSNCECALASFYSLCLGVAALLWLCGPWAILFLTRHARKGWLRGACPECGYPRRTDATVCSECGAAFPCSGSTVR